MLFKNLLRLYLLLLLCLVLPGCGGGGGGGGGAANGAPNGSQTAAPVNPDTLQYVTHSLVQNSIKVMLPYWESSTSGSAGDPILEPEIEPLDISEGKWRALFLVIETDSIDESFIREIRDINIISSHDLEIDGYPAHQYVYEGYPHQEIYKVESIIDIEDDSELDGTKWIPDSFRFLHTTVEVGEKFYTLLYAADRSYFTRYEAVAYSLAEAMRFGFLLPLQSSQISGSIASVSNGNQTLLAYCERDASNELSLKTVRLTSGRISTSPVTIDRFPSEVSSCTTTALTFDGISYLLTYSVRSGTADTLYANFLNNSGEAIDQGKVLDTVSAADSAGMLENVKVIYTGERFFLVWIRNQASNDGEALLEGFLLDRNYDTSDIQLYATNLVVAEDHESQRLEVAHNGDTIALVWNFPTVAGATPSSAQLTLLNNDGDQLSSVPITVRTSGAEVRDPSVAVIGSTVSVFWVERTTSMDGSGGYDDQLFGHQYSLLGELRQPTPTLIMRPKGEAGTRYEKFNLQVKPYAETFYILWESKRVVSDLYTLAVNVDLTLRSNVSAVTTAPSGIYQLLGFHHDNESYLAWLPKVSANFLQVWPFSREGLAASSWVMTESPDP